MEGCGNGAERGIRTPVSRRQWISSPPQYRAMRSLQRVTAMIPLSSLLPLSRRDILAKLLIVIVAIPANSNGCK